MKCSSAQSGAKNWLKEHLNTNPLADNGMVNVLVLLPKNTAQAIL